MRPVRRPSHRPLLLQEPDLFELLWQADGGAIHVPSRAQVGGLLKDRVMPKVPYRQWVVSLPFELRMLVAFDSDVANAVFRIATSAIFGAVKSLAAAEGVLGTPAGILHIQRFSDGTMLNVHGHFVVSDGVFAEVPTSGRTHESDPGLSSDPGRPALDVLFQPTRAPTQSELADVAMAIEHGVRRYLTRRASQRHSDDCSPDIEASRAREVLERLARAKPIAERTSSGEGPASSHSKPAVAKLAARSPAGFDVHAGVAIAAHARTALEKLLAYLARPPVPSSRLRLLKNGNVAFDLKRMWARGAKTLEFQPLAFIARLAALMPPPKFPMLRYLGVISAHARLRSRVLPEPPREAPERPILCLWDGVQVGRCRGRSGVHAHLASA
jgi:hypothetical protein